MDFLGGSQPGIGRHGCAADDHGGVVTGGGPDQGWEQLAALGAVEIEIGREFLELRSGFMLDCDRPVEPSLPLVWRQGGQPIFRQRNLE